MARVLLISANTTTEPYPVYPLGMSYLADALRKTGHQVQELDTLVLPRQHIELKTAITSFMPEIIGISIRNIDNFNYTLPQSYSDTYTDLVRDLHQVSTAPIVLGGPGYSLYPDILLKRTGADYGIVGEGEIRFPKLIESLENGNSHIVPSVVYPSEDEDVPCFGTSYRNQKLAEFYIRHGGMLNVQTKRGCPLKCIYCSYPRLEGKQYRFRDPVEVVDEIESLHTDFKMDHYAIADSVFNDSQGHYLAIAEELVRRNINIPFTAFLRPASFSDEDAQLMKNAGLHSVEWGTDGTSDQILQALGKGFSWSEVIHSNRLFSQKDIACCHYIMIGGPEETPDTLSQGIKNMEQLKQAVVMFSLGVRIIPGTKLHDLALKQNRIGEKDDLLEPVYYFSSAIDPAETDRLLRHAYKDRMDRIYPMGQQQDLEKVSAFHDMGYRGPIWNFLIGSR